MYKIRRKFFILGTNILFALLFAVVTFFLMPKGTFFIAFFVALIVFVIFQVITSVLSKTQVKKMYKNALETKETGLLSEFIKKLQFSYSIDDLIESIHSSLENKGDCSVLYIDRKTNYVIYNSPANLTTSEETMRILSINYSSSWPNGFFYMDDQFGISSKKQNTRGFFLSFEEMHFYVFCRYTRLFEPLIFPQLFTEFSRFQQRTRTISSLSEIAELSKEWSLLAETQKSFLPQVMPEISKLDVAAYFRPLVNVSGDYYSVLPMDENKTLVMLGDVSGKGLAAALVMGLVMNVVKIIENKEDLAQIVRSIDEAIKGMKLQDKYTVLFIGIIDTKEMNIRYINASMSDPIIVTQTPAGYRIKPLTSNCSLIGILELEEVVVAEQKLYKGDLVLMASDGVSEVMNEDGVELGDTDLYLDTIKNSANKSAEKFINDIEDLVMEYKGSSALRDDVTMLVAKVDR